MKQKKLLQENPELSLKYSKMVESELNKRFKFMIKHSPEAAEVRQVRSCSSLDYRRKDLLLVKYAIKEMTQRLSGHEDLIEAMIPKTFEVGCRRPTVSWPIELVLNLSLHGF